MFSSRLPTALFVLLASGSGVPTARAESAVPDNLLLFNRGTELFNAGDFERAADAFRSVVANRSPLAPAAMLYVAKCQRRLEHWDEAERILAGLDPADENLAPGLADERGRLADALSAAGTRSLEAGRAEEALLSFVRSLAQRKDGEAAYGRALALERLGRTAEARAAFRDYAATYPDGRYVADAVALARAAGALPPGPVWLKLEAGAGYDSNVFLTAPADTPVSAAALRGDVDVGVRLLEGSPGPSLRLRYRGSWTEHVNQLSGRYVSHALRGEASYADARWLLRAAPALNYQTVGDEPYVLQLGGVLGVDYATGDESVLGFQYEGYRNFAQSGAYGYIDGASHWGDVHVDRWLDRFRARLSYLVGVEAIRDLFSGPVVLPLAHVAHGPSLRVAWAPNDWELSLSVVYLFRSYDHPAQPGMRKRADEQLGATARVARSLGASTSFFVTGSVLWNRSTLDATSGVNDRNYTQLLTLAGISWNALD